ncbi:Testis-expressed sequence 2 protein [Portunus trituberculatus]|uniref:Testis-expressed sequence 2 protein n=2 Tax=Portunus trituberculatus TaxID=210409 RepID=A0A5B7JSU2_PORTR|nr:Testis-expressed sequence 2 protein [Portunus trituberculatus]
MGSATPHLLAAGAPHLDSRGLWVDLSVEYTGNFTLSLETKLDLMKLKRSGELDHGHANPHTHTQPAPVQSLPPSPGEPAHPRLYTRCPSSDRLLRNLHFDTDTDDSVESSSEEEEEEEAIAEAGLPSGGGPTSRRLLRLVDTVAASRYFQHAAEWRLLQRALQGVSNTRIELSVEVRRLAGTLALNVPPPPTDRLWYGFRGAPELAMVARPRLGDRALSLPILVEFIQRQLKVVFEKVFVLPNMDDLVIPIMSPLLPGQHIPPRPPWETQPHPTHPHHPSNTSDAPFAPPQSPPRPTPHHINPVVKFTPSSH